MSWLQSDTERVGDVLGGYSFFLLHEEDEDFPVSGWQLSGRLCAVLEGQFQYGLVRDVQAFQGAFHGGELPGEVGDLFTQPLSRLDSGVTLAARALGALILGVGEPREARGAVRFIPMGEVREDGGFCRGGRE